MFDFLSSKHERDEPNGSPRDDVDAPSALEKLPSASDKINTEKKSLEAKMFCLYHLAWLGIYQVHDENGRDHATRLAELFDGAGMSSYVDNSEQEPGDHYRKNRARYTGAESCVLNPLWTALNKKGLMSLKLFEGPSVTSLEAVIQLLEAYVKEVAGVDTLYQVLRELQVGFRTPTEVDEQAVLKQFVPIANQFAKRLMHLDARLKVLVSDMEDEFWNEHGAAKGREGWLVHYAVFPPSSARAGKQPSFMSSKA
ncbi:hypothetical protein N7466_003484 [Penicillium verhagenii]|uniref:uncharacterized protein n=1 Tax=Penicillium verhagenii TaxID=1562060 RepID=UPI002544D9B9|nr:uncharacterized protein N7466_003484 [Penicillium verhagenii]KAJ5937034.1 hypothetical protein N7466_003484 [Penicillium verhagenii]